MEYLGVPPNAPPWLLLAPGSAQTGGRAALPKSVPSPVNPFPGIAKRTSRKLAQTGGHGHTFLEHGHNLHGHGHNLHGHPGSKEVGVGRARPTLARRQRAARVHQLASAIASSVFWQTDRRAGKDQIQEVEQGRRK